MNILNKPLQQHTMSFIRLFVIPVIYLVCHSHLSAHDFSEFIDSIEQQNLYAHDTVKIKNYIFIHEKLEGRDLDTSLYFINKALVIDSLTNRNSFKARLLLLKGQIIEDQHDYPTALKIYKESLELANIHNRKKLVVEINNSMGILHIKMNMLDEAFSYLMTALRLCNKKNNPYIYSSIINNLGYVYQLQKKYKKALEYFRQSYENYRKINDEKSMANAYNSIGGMYFYLGEKDSVLYYFNKAIKIYEELNDVKSQSSPIFNIGETYYEMNQYDKAISYILKSYEIDKTYNNKEGMAIALNFLGKIYSKTGYYLKAMSYFEQALEICLEINNLRELKEVYLNLSDNYSRLQQYEKALHYHQLYAQVKDSVFNMETTNKILELETRYETEQQKKENEYQKLKIQSQQSEIRKQFVQKTAVMGGFVLLLIIFVIIFRSYRSKIRSNRLLKEQKEQIETMSEKMHLVDKMKIDFFTNISHELRTPLTVILGMSGELLSKSNGDIQFNQKTGAIKRNAVKLTALVNQLLDLRKIDDGEMTVSIVHGDIGSFIYRVIVMLESLAMQKDVKIDYRKQKDKIEGCFDPDKLEKIMINLLSNAIKFSKKGDTVTVQLETIGNKPGFISLMVEDTGVGIPADQEEYIFKPFFQASNNSHGSGIGLALTKEMVELMNGTIIVESRENEGTCFTVQLPVERKFFKSHVKCREIQTGDFISDNNTYLEMLMQENIRESKLVEEHSIIPLEGDDRQSVLIVEDNHDLRDYLVNIFNKEYLTYTAVNGKEGLDKALEKFPDIIVCDVMMPEMDGFELCNRVKSDERTSHIPVILLTAKTGEENVIAGLDQGADDYIIKPFSAGELQARVKNMIIQRQKLREKFSKELDTIEPEAVAVSPLDQLFLKKAISIVEQSITDPAFGPGVFVTELGMSRTLVYRKLKSLTGMSASRFIASVRLRNAARILRRNEKNVSEVAYAVGFSDQAYFTRLFKQTFNKTPKEYIKS